MPASSQISVKPDPSAAAGAPSTKKAKGTSKGAGRAASKASVGRGKKRRNASPAAGEDEDTAEVPQRKRKVAMKDLRSDVAKSCKLCEATSTPKDLLANKQAVRKYRDNCVYIYICLI